MRSTAVHTFPTRRTMSQKARISSVRLVGSRPFPIAGNDNWPTHFTGDDVLTNEKDPVLLALERLEAKLDDHDARVTDRLERLAEAVLYMSKTLHAPTEQEKVRELLYA